MPRKIFEKTKQFDSYKIEKIVFCCFYLILVFTIDSNKDPLKMPVRLDFQQ